MIARTFLTLLLMGSLNSFAFAQTDASPTETREERTSEAGAVEPAPRSEAGLAAWGKLNEVFSHPRCANCHVDDDRPRWTGAHYGAREGVHGLNVKRGDDGFGNTGLTCQTCHASKNSPKRAGPPGAENWHLAPVEMVWFGKSSAAICEQIKDPERNGQRTLQEVAGHVRNDPLVAWGWEPGRGREAAPGSIEETYNLLQIWIAEGAPCPSG